MAKCKTCGRKYSVWHKFGSTEFFSHLCYACYTDFIKAKADAKRDEEISAKQKSDQQARTILPAFLKKVVPEKTFRAFAVAYWDTFQTSASTTFHKFVGGAVLGGIGWATTPSSHRMGVIAVSNDELFVIDVGQVLGEIIIPALLEGQTSTAQVMSAPLNRLHAVAQHFGSSAILNVGGGFECKFTLPNSFDSTNALRARIIKAAIDLPGQETYFDALVDQSHCFNHPTKPSIGVCTFCGRSLCELCLLCAESYFQCKCEPSIWKSMASECESRLKEDIQNWEAKQYSPVDPELVKKFKKIARFSKNLSMIFFVVCPFLFVLLAGLLHSQLGIILNLVTSATFALALPLYFLFRPHLLAKRFSINNDIKRRILKSLKY
jgi:hypothetical protein